MGFYMTDTNDQGEIFGVVFNVRATGIKMDDGVCFGLNRVPCGEWMRGWFVKSRNSD